MERIWLKIIVVMICGDIIKLFADSIILRLVTDIVVFIIAAVMLGKDKLIDRRKVNRSFAISGINSSENNLSN